MTDEPPPLTLRSATPGDADLLLAWRNDPLTRQWSRNPGLVAQADHRNWLRNALASPDRILLIAQDAEQMPVGTIRFDRVSGGSWEVSITVAPECRGRGLARRVLAAGERELGNRQPADTVLASVHEDNTVSIRLFCTAGYRQIGGAGRFRRFTKALTGPPPESLEDG